MGLNPDRRAGIVQVPLEEIARLCGLPDGHRLTAMQSDWVRGVLELRIEGDMMPLTAMGASVPQVKAVYMKTAPNALPRILRFENI